MELSVEELTPQGFEEVGILPTSAEVKLAVEKEFGIGSVMSMIAKCESVGYRQYDESGNVLRGKINPDDIGVFQINTYYHLESSKKMGLDIFTLQGNIAYAKYLYDTQGTRPWNWSKGCWGK